MNNHNDLSVKDYKIHITSYLSPTYMNSDLRMFNLQRLEVIQSETSTLYTQSVYQTVFCRSRGRESCVLSKPELNGNSICESVCVCVCMCLHVCLLPHNCTMDPNNFLKL